jgi:alanine-glyoxylate transaminase/serine-glyoxylate transaminase/serine-pyruvate transaminase
MSDQNPVFIPGPTNIPGRLLNAMHVQTRDHRSPDFVATLAPVLNDLKRIFATETGEIITFPSTGTGGWEAAICNTLSPGDKVLIARYGMFSHRWIDLCQRHNLEVEIIECPWGSGAPADLFKERLKADSAKEIKAVLVTHNETATGVRSDIKAVRGAIDNASHPAMMFVDCVSSLGCMAFEMDSWGVDIAISGSQKGCPLAWLFWRQARRHWRRWIQQHYHAPFLISVT